MKTNLPQHPCANKCTNFKEEQCGHCLVNFEPKANFLPGDIVVSICKSVIMTVHKVQGKGLLLDGNRSFALIHLVRHANVQELNAGKRLGGWE